jgi:hypothetical protein
MAGIGRARHSRLRIPCLLFVIGAVAAIEPPFLIAAYDWRYELPQLSLIPIAAVLGVTALAGRASDRISAASPTGAKGRVHTGQPTDANQNR